jgi:large subunit ribosomal protein L6
MSRVAKKPVSLPKGVEINLSGQQLSMKGPKGSLQMALHPSVRIEKSDTELNVQAEAGDMVMAGTTRALLNNMVVGVTKGYERKLLLVGVGYRAQAQGKKLNLTLGFSHPVEYAIPEGVKIETPSQTEILISGIDKQKVGQAAADIRSYRRPEPYKGKGVRYSDERIVLKEAKKK